MPRSTSRTRSGESVPILAARIGTLSPERVREVLRGIDLILQPREVVE